MRKNRTTYRRLRPLPLIAALALGLLSTPPTDALAQKQSGTPRTGTTRRADQKKETEKTDRIVTAAQLPEEPVDLAVRTLTDSTGSGDQQKKPVAAPLALTSGQVARLRVADERIDNVIPFRGYPLTERLPAEKRSIYGDATFGLYSTLRLAAGYSGESWPYDYSLSGNYLTTQGDPDNGAQTQLAATLSGGYIIGDSYGIFSGGHMGARAHYGSAGYLLYALPEAPQRDVKRTEVEMTGGNTYRGIGFDARGGYRSLEARDSLPATERSIDGRLALSRKVNEITFGGAADARWTVSNDTSISYGELAGHLKYEFPSLTLQGGAALVVAGESDGSTLVRLAPRAEARLFLAGAITVTAGVHGGVTQNTLASLLRTNPYTDTRGPIRHDVATVGYSAGIRIEPSRTLAFTADLRNTEYSQYAYFAERTGGTFTPRYDNAQVGTVDATFFWRIGNNDEVAALATYTRGTLGSNAGAIPYLPAIVGEASYRKRLASVPLTLTTHIRYIGEREGGAGTTRPGVILAGIEGRYQVTAQFDVALEFRNILNTSYELWDGYRERGVFAALGIKSRFQGF